MFVIEFDVLVFMLLSLSIFSIYVHLTTYFTLSWHITQPMCLLWFEKLNVPPEKWFLFEFNRCLVALKKTAFMFRIIERSLNFYQMGLNSGTLICLLHAQDTEYGRTKENERLNHCRILQKKKLNGISLVKWWLKLFSRISFQIWLPFCSSIWGASNSAVRL